MYAALNPHLPALKPARGPQRIGFAMAVVLHASALAAVFIYEPTRSVILNAAPIMVEWITPTQPRIEPPVRRPLPKPVVEPQPKVVEPAPIAAATDQVSAPPAPSMPSAEPVAVATQVPAPVTQPIFTADYLDNPAPAYPPLSRRLHEEGRVMLRVKVNVSGRADDVQVVSSSGFERLDGSAAQTVKQWKFVPAKRGAEAVPAWVLIPVSFKLEG